MPRIQLIAVYQISCPVNSHGCINAISIVGSYTVFILKNAYEKMMQEDGEVDDDRISISISRKAYEALLEYTKQLNQENPEAEKSFTVEEVLDEEIIFLFSDEWKKDQY